MNNRRRMLAGSGVSEDTYASYSHCVIQSCNVPYVEFYSKTQYNGNVFDFAVIDGVTCIADNSQTYNKVYLNSGVHDCYCHFIDDVTIFKAPFNSGSRIPTIFLLTIPDFVTTIPTYGFKDGTYKNVVCYPKTPPSVSNLGIMSSVVFNNIYVPDDSVNLYKSASGWSSYSSKIKPLSEFNINDIYN